MKNLTRLFGGLFLGLGFLSLASPVHAAWYKGTPKEVFVSSYTTGPVQITPTVSTQTVTASQYQPGAIYQVQMSSGAASEYIIVVDTTNCLGITSTMSPGTTPAQTYTTLTPHLLYTSTSAITTVTFDPPLRFDQGLCVIDSANTGSFGLTYELGRGISGQ